MSESNLWKKIKSLSPGKGYTIIIDIDSNTCSIYEKSRKKESFSLYQEDKNNTIGINSLSSCSFFSESVNPDKLSIGIKEEKKQEDSSFYLTCLIKLKLKAGNFYQEVINKKEYNVFSFQYNGKEQLITYESIDGKLLPVYLITDKRNIIRL